MKGRGPWAEYCIAKSDNIAVKPEVWDFIYFLKPDSPDMDNLYLVDRKLGRIVVPWDQFPVYVDLLRNEKPIYAYLNSNTPISNRVYTGQEPVGEEED
jgi:hypothetical protein